MEDEQLTLNDEDLELFETELNDEDFITKKFLVMVRVAPKDFCESDLREAIVDGLANVGNYECNNVDVDEVE